MKGWKSWKEKSGIRTPGGGGGREALAGHKRSPQKVAVAMFLDIEAAFNNATFGSMREVLIEKGVVKSSEIKKQDFFPLGSVTTVFQAEIVAISKAARTRGKRQKNYVFCW